MSGLLMDLNHIHVFQIDQSQSVLFAQMKTCLIPTHGGAGGALIRFDGQSQYSSKQTKKEHYYVSL